MPTTTEPSEASAKERRPLAIGDILDDGKNYPGRCKVIALHPFGTIDIERLSDGQCFRMTGLWMNRSGETVV